MFKQHSCSKATYQHSEVPARGRSALFPSS
uniref:Uncharacterized protein n=1 Tax=Arundo donax TaxID=35708 RepID=A0A0A9B0N0_ARUDO